MTPADKAARAIKQATLRTITKNLGYSYLGLRLTNGQLKAGARTLYDRHTHQKPAREYNFFWDNNNLNTENKLTCHPLR